MSDEAEVTGPARDAIRRYMLLYVIPSGVFFTIVSGALGYVVSGLARIDASAEAAKYTLKAVDDAAKASANTTSAAAEANDAKKKAVTAADSAEVFTFCQR
jgi:hypothetical protein